MRFQWTEKLLQFKSVAEKNWRKRFPLPEIRFVVKYWPPGNCNNGFQKM